MKKGKVIGKGHIAVVIMLLALGTAVWLNMRFSNEKYLGEAKYVDNSSGDAIETSAKAEKTQEDSFKTAEKEREKAYNTISEEIDDILEKEQLTDDDKTKLQEITKKYADRIERESNIEALLRAKGFEKALAVIGDKFINIIVKSDGITTTQTLQIQDIVTGETNIEIENIKIVSVK